MTQAVPPEFVALVAELVVETKQATITTFAESSDPRARAVMRQARRLYGEHAVARLGATLWNMLELEAAPRAVELLNAAATEAQTNGAVDRAELFQRARILGAALVPTILETLGDAGPFKN